MKYKTSETLLLKYLGSSPTLRIVDFLLDNPFSDYSKNEIVKNLEMWAELPFSNIGQSLKSQEQ